MIAKTLSFGSPGKLSIRDRHIPSFIPDEGFISVLKVTDKQFGETIHLQGRKQKPAPPTPAQLELF